jgi:hypothetical protein
MRRTHGTEIPPDNPLTFDARKRRLLWSNLQAIRQPRGFWKAVRERGPSTAYVVRWIGRYGSPRAMETLNRQTHASDNQGGHRRRMGMAVRVSGWRALAPLAPFPWGRAGGGVPGLPFYASPFLARGACSHWYQRRGVGSSRE